MAEEIPQDSVCCAVHIDKLGRLGVLKYAMVYTVTVWMQHSHTSYCQDSR